MRRRDGARLLCAASSPCAATGPAILHGAALRLAALLDEPLRDGAQHQLQRRLSHYAASTSGTTSGAAPAAARASGSASPERGFASQPAYAYDAQQDATVPAIGLQAPVAAPPPRQTHPPPGADLLGRARDAAAMLKARALSRLEEVSSLEQASLLAQGRRLPFHEQFPAAARPLQQLTRVRQVEEMSPSLPVWERLMHVFSDNGASNADSSAALREYRREVLRGQDPDAQRAAAAADGHDAVPFLRSGVYAAQQGFGLQSDVGRLALRSRLPPVEEIPVSRRTAFALEGLRVLMDNTRNAAAEGSQGGEVEAGVQLVLANLAAAATPSLLHSAVPEAAAARPAEPEAAAEAAAARRGRAASRHEGRAELPRPSADPQAVLLALSQLPAVDIGRLAEGVMSLYGDAPRCRRHREALEPAAQLTVPQQPAACLERIAGAAAALVQELGGHHFAALVQAAPWVLLLDPQRHGRPQLACLHLVDASQRDRAALVLAFPRLLTLDTEAALLPALEYLQGLGMSNKQIVCLLKTQPKLCQPSALLELKTVASFWLGRGMTKPDLVHMLTAMHAPHACNLASWQLSFDWLAEHAGLTLEDMSRMPFIASRSLAYHLGPRVALALEKGFKLWTPSSRVGRRAYRRQGAPPGAAPATLALATLLRATDSATAKRLGVSELELHAFQEQWQRCDFAAWLRQRQGGIERYRDLTGRRGAAHRGAATAGHQERQQGEAMAAEVHQQQESWEQAEQAQELAA